MKKTNRKNVLIYLMALLVSISLLKNKNNKKEIVDLTDDKSYSVCGNYSRGKVYMCDSMHDAECASLVCDEADVIVVDQTEYKDPNMKIVSSYKITDKDEMIEILNIIKEYCQNKESNWNRSITSMQNEWLVHNICSNMHIKRSSTDDVDLNNSDENLYNSKIVGKMLGN